MKINRDAVINNMSKYGEHFLFFVVATFFVLVYVLVGTLKGLKLLCSAVKETVMKHWNSRIVPSWKELQEKYENRKNK